MKYLTIAALLFLVQVAAADVCPLTIDATDDMRFEQETLQVETRCTDVEVTLHHTGKLPAHIMGHDWVLTKTSDVAAVANATTAWARGSRTVFSSRATSASLPLPRLSEAARKPW
jgi:azurin